ncbi:MAG: DUF3617 family protein [Porticoccus sp.]|nr:DUF3617 family protein [Porticoccus sp.]
MKKLLLCTLICFASSVFAETKIRPPDMALGHWITTADMSKIIEQTLAKMPEDSRAMIRGMMEEKMKGSSTTEQCITEDTLNNFDQQIKETFSNDTDCEFNIIESSSKTFMSAIECPGSVIQITMIVINDKRNGTTVVNNVVGQDKTEITSVSEWQSSICPAGL